MAFFPKLNALTWRFAAAFLVVLAVALGLYWAWSSNDFARTSEQKVLDEARLLVQQMDASWDYIDNVQDVINYNDDGSYDFKGVYCSVAGKTIAANFTANSNCAIRYIRENPRTKGDEPDDFEAEALAAFARGETEHFAVRTIGGQTVFHYVSVLPVKYGCLQCHGTPKGELDETGYEKEGMALGDVAGAVSLLMPMEAYEREASGHAVSYVLLFVAVAVALIAVAGFFLNRWVTAPLEEADVRLEGENEMKSSFLATMSHELRTPLASSIAYVDVWMAEHADAPKDERAQMAGIKRNCQNLLATVNNSLDAASIEAQAFAVSPVVVDLFDVVNEVEGVAAPLAREKGVRMVIEAPPDLPVVRTDPSIVRKILDNLLSNAIKFTDAGGTVRLGLAWQQARLVMVVQDDGVGIAEEELPFIFDKFHQADSRLSRLHGGSGLGLALVRDMAQLLGGDVTVESTPGMGSTFTVEIACEEA